MANGLKYLRVRAGMTQEAAAAALGLSKGGYVKLEGGDRRLTQAVIERACAVFNVEASAVLAAAPADSATRALANGPPGAPLDPALLASLIAAARERLGGLSEAEARTLVEALIAVARMPGRRP